MELGCVIVTVKSKSTVCGMQKNEQSGAGMRNNDHKELEQGLWNAEKEQDGAGMRNNDP